MSGPHVQPAVHAWSMGGLALSMAGVEARALAPGQAPPSVMRQALRHAQGSQAEAEGLDTATAAERIGKRSGQPLPEAVRARMERAFGHDFRHVRIHTDGSAAAAADALHAVAFAVGRDLYFGPGAFRPGTPDGDALLAHELTHVVQADEGRLPSHTGGLDVSRPTDPHEREAEAWSRLVSRTLDATPAADVSTEAGEWAAVAAPEAGADTASAPSDAALASRQAAPVPPGPTRTPEDAESDDELRTVSLDFQGETVTFDAPGAVGESVLAEADLDQTLEVGEGAGLRVVRAVVQLDPEGPVMSGSVEVEGPDSAPRTLDVRAGGLVDLDAPQRGT